MCVILHGLKKKHIRREELVQAMQRNGSGFFIAALREDGKRDVIRTLDKGEALSFFDTAVKDDDQVVVHARIPSYGPASVENVHGWEECGILFAHNMSLRSIDGFRDMFQDWKQKTDSEFFFRKMFIPYYKSLGEDAYKDGEFHEDLDRYVKWICGTSNKFVFVMPDNKVLRYGEWVCESDRKENGEVAMWASNLSYRVTSQFPRERRSDEPVVGYGGYGGQDSFGAYTPSGSYTEKRVPGARILSHRCDDGDEYVNLFTRRKKGNEGFLLGDDLVYRFKGTSLADRLSVASVLKLSVTEWVFACLSSTSLIGVDETEVAKRLRELQWMALPFWVTDEGIETTKVFLPSLVDGTCIDEYLSNYVPVLEAAICTVGGRYPNAVASDRTVSRSLCDVYRDADIYKRFLNVEFRFDQPNPRNIAVAYELEKSRKGVPVMKRLDPIDVFGHDEMSPEDTFKAFGNILTVINSDVGKEAISDHPILTSDGESSREGDEPTPEPEEESQW